MLPEQNIAARKKIKLTELLWFVLTGELVVFLAVMFVLQSAGSHKIQLSNAAVIQYIVYGSVIVLLPVVFKIYDRAKVKAATLSTIEEKADLYLKTKLIVFVLIEFVALIIFVMQYIYPERAHLYAFGIVFIADLFVKSGKGQFLKDFTQNTGELL
ncbi:MAG: hypothetical protein CSB06_01665 [Bacteroidia bacterium]|nr:MAG: hypothetical protein CSB06_01665 [Bacteroidia bacterium]